MSAAVVVVTAAIGGGSIFAVVEWVFGGKRLNYTNFGLRYKVKK